MTFPEFLALEFYRVGSGIKVQMTSFGLYGLYDTVPLV